MMRLVCISAITLVACILGVLETIVAADYSSGLYGSCNYGKCSITLESEPSVSVDVTPVGGATRCSVQGNVVTVITRSSTGYIVTVNNGDTVTALEGPDDGVIASTSGTEDSPVALSANTWGYRVDGIASFGSGPTTPLADAAVPPLLFAGVPSFASSGGVVRYTETVDEDETPTTVWYGVCVDSSTPAGVYSDDILYTAIIN